LSQSASACFVASFLCRPTWINLFSFLYFGFAAATSFIENFYPFIVDIIYMDREGTAVSEDTWNWLTILVLPLMPWMSFARAFDELARQTTIIGDPFTWSDLAGPGTAYPPGMFNGDKDPNSPQTDGFTAPSALVSVWTLILAVPWLTFLSWWSAQVYGGELRKRFFFPLQPSYWGCGKQLTEVAAGDAIGKQKLLSGHERSIRIHKLSKSFKTVTAVKELSLTMERNRVFCVLGHNGAGKTTLLNTLTGLHDPTFGEAFVCGHSIRTEMPAIQRLMGVCPQHDVLWDDLTAKQILQFYARFKGIAGSKLDKYIDDAIAQFGLHDEANKRVGTFSG
jgi:ABC-type multidrug transport system fused ATPase/permease subunit